MNTGEELRVAVGEETVIDRARACARVFWGKREWRRGERGGSLGLTLRCADVDDAAGRVPARSAVAFRRPDQPLVVRDPAVDVDGGIAGPTAVVHQKHVRPFPVGNDGIR